MRRRTNTKISKKLSEKSRGWSWYMSVLDSDLDLDLGED